jgi:hypothetical protein
LRIFVGSSGEGQKKCEEIAECLRAEGAEVLAWYDTSAFPRGRTFIESLESILRRSDCALLVATADDRTVRRGDSDLAPRDNIVLEYGMCAAALGRERTALALIGNPRLPTDLLGVSHIQLPNDGDLSAFRQGIRVPLRQWMEQLLQVPHEFVLHTDLPNLYKRIVSILKRLIDENPERRHQIDLAASDVIESVAQSFDSKEYGFGDVAEFAEQELLRECNGILVQSLTQFDNPGELVLDVGGTAARVRAAALVEPRGVEKSRRRHGDHHPRPVQRAAVLPGDGARGQTSRSGLHRRAAPERQRHWANQPATGLRPPLPAAGARPWDRASLGVALPAFWNLLNQPSLLLARDARVILT